MLRQTGVREVPGRERPAGTNPLATARGRDEVALGRGVRVKHFTSPRFRPDGLDFTVGRGEVVVVTGPSGCGKSSLAMTLSGLIPHRVDADLAGSVLVFGREVAATTDGSLVRDVGMVFQDPCAQLVTTNVLDEVCFGLENLEVPADQLEPRALAALTMVGLDGHADEAPARLSGGQQQRLALACALAMRPKLLVLDEPTSHLDPRAAAEFYALIPGLVASGMTLVVIEHDLDPVLGYADRLLVLDRRGGLLAEGPPSEVLAADGDRLSAAGVRLPTAIRVRRALAQVGPPPAAGPVEPVPTRPDDRPALLRATHLSVRRGRRTVVSDLSLTIDAGETVAIVGENGAGKTTVGLALAGLIRSRGELRIAGRDPRRLSMRELSDRVGYVFQNPEHQFITNTVADEIAHGPRRRRASEAAVGSTVDELLERLALGQVRGQHPFLLSGGEKRRLSVATVLATRPRLLLLDEPTYGLDAGAADSLMGLLAELNREGVTVVTIVHDLALAADHASRVIVLRKGSIVADGSAAAILTNDRLLTENGLAPLPVRTCLADLGKRDPRFRAVYRLDQLARMRR